MRDDSTRKWAWSNTIGTFNDLSSRISTLMPPGVVTKACPGLSPVSNLNPQFPSKPWFEPARNGSHQVLTPAHFVRSAWRSGTLKAKWSTNDPAVPTLVFRSAPTRIIIPGNPIGILPEKVIQELPAHPYPSLGLFFPIRRIQMHMAPAQAQFIDRSQLRPRRADLPQDCKAQNRNCSFH